jgi:hypothetical protein
VTERKRKSKERVKVESFVFSVVRFINHPRKGFLERSESVIMMLGVF